MMIIGHGIDIVDINRIKNVYQIFKNNFIEKILTSQEISNNESLFKVVKNLDFYSESFNIVSHILSKRFAAKEALAKALGTGIGPISFHDIEIYHNSFGKPHIQISNKLDSIIQHKIKETTMLSRQSFKNRNEDIKHNNHIYDLNKQYNIHLSISDEKNSAIASVIIEYFS